MCAKWVFVLAAWVVCGCSEQDRGDPTEATHVTQTPRVPIVRANDPPQPVPGVVRTTLRNAQAPDPVDSDRTVSDDAQQIAEEETTMSQNQADDPTVSDDAQQIAELRKLYDREIDTLVDSTIERIGKLKLGQDLSWLLSDQACRLAFAQRKDRARAELGRIMTSDTGSTDSARANAACALCVLGDRDGERFLVDALKTGPAPMRRSALWNLAWNLNLFWSPGDRAQLILAQIDHPDPAIVAAAASLCARYKIPGAEVKLVSVLKSGRVKDTQQIAEVLAEFAERPEAIEIMLAHIFPNGSPPVGSRTYDALRRLGEHPDPKVSEPVRAAVRRFALSLREGGTRGLALNPFLKRQNEEQGAKLLSWAADRGTIPILNEIIAHGSTYDQLHALEAMARLEPESAVDRLLSFIEREGFADPAVRTLQEYGSEKDADRIIAVLRGPRKGSRRPLISLAVTRLLIERLGARGRKVVEEDEDQLTPRARMWAMWKLNGLNLRAAFDELRGTGVIGIAYEPLLEKMRHAREPGRFEHGIGLYELGSMDPSDPDILLEALSRADLVTAFDVETGHIPCRHHLLAMRFAENSAGRFPLECAVQAVQRKGEDAAGSLYQVRFLYRGRLYRFGAENRGDWYDVAAVQRALNFALKTAGQRERFIALGAEGQMAAFVFADPAAFFPIAKKYGLPLSDDPDAAMRRGKEFERQAIERLQHQGIR